MSHSKVLGAVEFGSPKLVFGKTTPSVSVLDLVFACLSNLITRSLHFVDRVMLEPHYADLLFQGIGPSLTPVVMERG